MSLEYITPEQAFDVAQERIEDREIQERVMEFFGASLPPGFEGQNRPLAVFAPYLAKGTEREVEFLAKASKAGFATMIATYKDSQYVTSNSGIVDCYRAPLKLPKRQEVRKWVVPTEERDGAVGDAKTVYPELDITDYWMGIRKAVLRNIERESPDSLIVDFGGWYRLQAERFGWTPLVPNKAPFYYLASMALYASGRAVLFAPPPSGFTSEVSRPAAAEVQEKLGVYPLVTNVLSAQKRDWADLAFLSQDEATQLLETGRISTAGAKAGNTDA